MAIIEVDEFDDKKPKYCPLTGERVGPECDWDCLIENCNNVDENRRYYLYGHTYRCKREMKEIVKWHENQIKAAETYRKLNKSLETARGINIDYFYEYCDNLDEEMVKSRQKYNRDMMINPYHEPNEKCLIYIFEGDEVIEISVVENPFSFLSARFDRLKDEGGNCAVNICSVPAYMAEAINVRLHLQRNMDVKAILHNDNPVYIKARSVGKYIDAVYGWDWVSFKRVRDRHLEMTEIVNFDNIIYIKQELDEIVRREYKDRGKW